MQRESHLLQLRSELLASILLIHTLQDGFSTSYICQKKALRRLMPAISSYSPYAYCQSVYAGALTRQGESDMIADMFKGATVVH